MKPESLIPVQGCWVRQRNTKQIGDVRDHMSTEKGSRLRVRWASGSEEWVLLGDIQSGFQLGWAVQDIPVSTTRRTLGTGRVVGNRLLGGREQVLVQLDDDGRSVWLPFENLRRLMDVRMRYERASV